RRHPGRGGRPHGHAGDAREGVEGLPGGVKSRTPIQGDLTALRANECAPSTLRWLLDCPLARAMTPEARWWHRWRCCRGRGFPAISAPVGTRAAYADRGC